MKFSDYLSDKLNLIILSILSYLIILIVIILSKVNNYLIFLVSIIYFVPIIFYIIWDYLSRNKYYQDLTNLVDNIDQKYLISEIINNGEFSDAYVINKLLYEIDRNYIEHLNDLKKINVDYKDYVETWCHEIKTPIATAKLIVENNKSKVTNSILEEIDRIEYLTEQILFYARMDTLECDYIINKVNLKDIINNVIKKNKKDILSKHIKINIKSADLSVDSDSKWLEFIINQLLTNSIKYSSINPSITFNVIDNSNNSIVTISDNGIGISEADIGRIFDKGFTGSTGRKYSESTGMGLYLAKNLCEKLGHKLSIISKENVGTTAYIVIPKNSTLDVLK
jgi:signal transduction histidine kinase